jgi:hypothetical protein
MLSLYFPAFVLLCIAAIALRRRPRVARTLYRLALPMAAVPYLLHVRYTYGSVSGFGDPGPRIGVYPGLVAFAIAGALGTLVLLMVAWVLVSRVPLATAALPPALWLTYWFGVLPLAYWQAPSFVPIDNKPLIWLFGFSAVATVLLALTAWLAFGRGPSRLHP